MNAMTGAIGAARACAGREHASRNAPGGEDAIYRGVSGLAERAVPDMLERFSDQACRVVVQAREEARALNHNWIGTEHLMLALIGEGSGVAAQVLESLEISLEAARWLVEQTIGRGERPPSGQLQFTPRARKVLELASGLSHGYDHVGSWHILLGLLREGDGVGAIVLFTLGADQYRVGLRTSQLLRGDRGNEASGQGSQPDARTYARLLDNPLARIDVLDRRLAAAEHRLDLQTDPGGLDQQALTLRRETAAAVDMQNLRPPPGCTALRRNGPPPGHLGSGGWNGPLLASCRWLGSWIGCTPSWTSCGRSCAGTASTRATPRIGGCTIEPCCSSACGPAWVPVTTLGYARGPLPAVRVERFVARRSR